MEERLAVFAMCGGGEGIQDVCVCGICGDRGILVGDNMTQKNTHMLDQCQCPRLNMDSV